MILSSVEDFDAPYKTAKMELDSAEIIIRTRTDMVPLTKRKINWTIENFSDLVKSRSCLRTQKFVFEIESNREMPRLKWEVRLEPKYDFDYNSHTKKNDISLECHVVSGLQRLSENTIFVIIELEILNERGVAWNTYKSNEKKNGDLGGLLDIKALKYNTDYPYGIKNYIEFELKHPRSGQNGLPIRKDGSLVFRLSFQFFTKRLSKTCFRQIQQANPELEKYWLKHVKARAANGNAAGEKPDVQLISRDGKKVDFHKQLLVARSPVFEAMFRAEMLESESGIVKLSDVSEEGVMFIHDVLYNGRMMPYLEKIRNAKDARDLEQWIYIASKYQFEDLIKFFDGILGTLCTEQNAMELLRLSNRFSLKKGRDYVKAFIVNHPDVLDEA